MNGKRTEKSICKQFAKVTKWNLKQTHTLIHLQIEFYYIQNKGNKQY